MRFKMKTALTGSLLILLLINGSMAGAQAKFITNAENRVQTSLNGKWKYVIDQYETGSIGFAPLYKNIKASEEEKRVEYSFDDAKTLWVPGSWNSQEEQLHYYEGSIWYRQTFDFKPRLKNSRVFIYIAGANYKTTYTFNGQKLGVHEGGFTPFSFEVTDLIKAKDNFVILGVSNRREKDYIPAKVTDWYNHGGITRDVMLVEVPQTYIEDFTFSMEKSSIGGKYKQVNVSVSLEGKDLPAETVLSIEEIGISQKITIGKDGKGKGSFKSKNLKLWSPEGPKLYDVSITAGADVIKDKIGFRVIETRGKKIFLNNKEVFLRGISIHDENPIRRDRAYSKDDAALLLGWAKELGCNFARLAHYPHQENIVRMADKMGILLWEEMPLYWGIQWGNTNVLEKAKQQYGEMIRRDKNRAASIIWSVANETQPGEARNKFLTEIANHIRANDPTRLISGALKKDGWEDDLAGNTYIVSDPIAESFDIVSFNEYQGWYGGSPLLCREKNFKIDYDKPVIISEFGGGAIQGFIGDTTKLWSEEYQAFVYRENIKMFERVSGLAGMTPWVLADFMSPLRQLPDVQDGWNRKGLVSERGLKKRAFFVLQDYYKSKEKQYK